MSKAISRRDFLKVTGAVGTAGLLAACGGGSSSTTTAASTAAPASVAAPTGENVDLTISWWGGDSRHEAVQAAIAAFTAKNPNISVAPTFGANTGWEDSMSTKFAGGVAEDVCMVNWNWMYNYSANGQTFIDLHSVSDYLDLTQFTDQILTSCTVANALQCVPTAMTARILYWNMNTFKKAGITEVPKTKEDLFAAGKAFQEKLGDDYYPLHMGAYDRMIFMVFYLESMYGKDWADPATSTLNYTAEEIAEGVDFIKSLVDGHVIMPLPTYYGKNGDTAAYQTAEWISGQLAGIFEWDSSASKYQDALDTDNRDGFTVGEEIKFGDYNGGFSKVATAFAVTQTAKHPAEAAMLINFILNDPEGAALIGSQFGIPASASGLAAATDAGTIDAITAEANGKALAFVSNQLDPLFEATDLKGTPGVYQDMFDTVDYDNVSGADVVDILLDGMAAVGYTV